LTSSARPRSWATIGKATVTINIPRRFLEKKPGVPLAFEFKWVDNMQDTKDATDWMVSGDAAPNSRFAYPFREAQQTASK
ncbi:MAG: hypothetical protein ABI579_08800, partial [Candidatus Sumerlaeota bacterium]